MPKLLILLTLLACFFLSTVGGAFLSYAGLLPGAAPEEPLSNGAEAAALAELQQPEFGSPATHPLLADNFFSNRLPQHAGVVSYDAARAATGYTLYAPVGPDFPMRLIDMAGNTVHEWVLDTALGPQRDGAGASGTEVVSRHPQLLSQGDLLVVVDAASGETRSGSVIRVDKESKVLWEYRGPVRHAPDVSPDGHTYALLHNSIDQPWLGLEHIETPFDDELIVELDAGGNELRRISLLAAIQNSSFEFLLQYARAKSHGGQLLGANSIQYLDAAVAATLPGVNAGDLLVSFAKLDTVAVVDIEEVAVTWAARGSWHLPHAAEMLANGNMLLFDSYGDLEKGGRSRVLEFDPVTLEIVWEFPGATGAELFTAGQGFQHRLSNGNTLISEAFGGRLVEVAPDGDVVWEYYAPEVMAVDESRYAAHAMHAHRYGLDQLAFLTQDVGVHE